MDTRKLRALIAEGIVIELKISTLEGRIRRCRMLRFDLAGLKKDEETLAELQARLNEIRSDPDYRALESRMASRS